MAGVLGEGGGPVSRGFVSAAASGRASTPASVVVSCPASTGGGGLSREGFVSFEASGPLDSPPPDDPHAAPSADITPMPTSAAPVAKDLRVDMAEAWHEL